VQKCKYCKKDLQKIDCLKFNKNIEDTISIHSAIVLLLTIVSFIYKPAKTALAKFRYKITCVNKDCIGYLDECCCVNKYAFSFKFRK